MIRFRKYGQPPYRICVIHGGPGAPGSLATLAGELSKTSGILEPFQAAGNIEGQMAELDDILDQVADKPVVMIGHSWGAWLSLIFAARFPDKVNKLVMIGSGPLTVDYVSRISRARNSRLSETERKEIIRLEQMLEDPAVPFKDKLMRQYSILMHKADSFDPLPFQDNCIAYQPDILMSVWTEASELRRSGKLIAKANDVACPLVVIHGNDDPHPWQGVIEPLKGHIKNMKFIRLEHCGHEPWQEKTARDKFFSSLKSELIV